MQIGWQGRNGKGRGADVGLVVCRHSLERSWPVIMGCTDPKIADRCGEDTYDKEVCQCFDEAP